MKQAYKLAGAFIVLLVLSVALAPEAQAFRGRGAAFAVGAAAGSSKAAGAEAEAAAAQQQAAASQQQAAAAQQQLAVEKEKTAAAQKEAAAAKQAAPPPAVAAGAPLPLGTVVSTLPGGCTPTPVGGVNYYYCGGNFYQAVYEGSTLKYITAKPK
jgi:hypothetical protein